MRTGAITVSSSSIATTTVTLSVGYPALSTGAASSGYAYYGEVLTTGSPIGHSRIATSSDPGTGAADFFGSENHSTARPLWSTERGTLLFQYVPLAGSTTHTSNRFLLCCGYSTTNTNWGLRWNAASSRLQFEIGSAATSMMAYSTGTLTANSTTKVAIRWTSTQGELGSTGLMVDAFVDGTKGPSLYPSSYPSFRGPLFFWDPANATASAGGYISNLTILPICLSDEEIAAW